MSAALGLAFGGVARLGLLIAAILIAAVTALGRMATGLIGGATGLGGRLLAPGYLALRAGLKALSVRLMLAATLFFGASAWGIMHSDKIRADFVSTNARATSPAIYDTVGFVGAFPSRQNADDASQDFASYSSIHGAAQPVELWACLKRLEDRQFGAWYTSKLGFDPVSAGRTLFAISVGGGGGHSNLTNQVSRSMHGTLPGAEAPGQRLERKLKEWSDSPALTYLLSEDGAHGAQFVLANLALVAGAPGSRAGSLPYGAEAASLIVFGKSVADIGAAQQFQLAAANWRPILVAPGNDPRALRTVDQRWARLKRRAARCLSLVADQPNYKEIKDTLEHLPPPRPVDSTLAASADRTYGFATAVNPVRRIRRLLNDGGVHQIGHDLDGVARGDWRGRVIRADLAFSTLRNFAFDQKVDTALHTLQRQLGSRLQLPLVDADAGSSPAQVLAVLVDAQTGLVLRFYESGPVAAFDQPRPVASLGKALVAAPVLARFDAPEVAYCNRTVTGVRNAGGDAGAASCNTAGAYVSAREVYARSMSLPLINRLSQISSATIRSTAASLGFNLPADIPPATSVPEGLFEATPRAALRGMMALSRAMAEIPGAVPQPRLLASVQSVLPDGAVVTEQPQEKALSWTPVRQAVWPVSPYLRQMLAAPLAPGGTLARLTSLTPQADSEFLFNVGKTGTSVTPTRLTRDTMIAGAFQLARSRHVFAYFVLVGTPTPATPLGDINATAFTPIARLLIEEARNTIH